MRWCWALFGLFLLLVAQQQTAAAAATPPPPVRACAVLTPERGQTETARIQAALNACPPTQAVVLRGGDFTSGPLIIPRGVTLFIDQGVTLYASRNQRLFDLAPGRCGVTLKEPLQPPACQPFLFAYQAAYSGISGNGTIDGQGDIWWSLVQKNGPTTSVPELVSNYESQNFHLYGVTLRNPAGIAAAIYKTIGLDLQSIRIEEPAQAPAASPAVLLSNAVDARVENVRVQAPGEALALVASILGPTTNVRVKDFQAVGGRGVRIGDDTYKSVKEVTFDGLALSNTAGGLRYVAAGQPQSIHVLNACLQHVTDAIQSPLKADYQNVTVDQQGQLDAAGQLAPSTTAHCTPAQPAPIKFTADTTRLPKPGTLTRLTVPDAFPTIQAAVDALPLTGGDITVKPGTYREVVVIRKPSVHLHGATENPTDTTIVFNNSSPNTGGTFNSATLFVEADNVTVDHLTIANDFGIGRGQAVALAVTADRAVFRHLRLLGAQDTLFAASRYCYGDYGPCRPARQYFADSYIEGNVDFIFGDSLAAFERCELHGLSAGSVMFTAQSKHTADQESGYVFDHCRLTGEARQNGTISLGRPWRPYASVVYLHCQIDAPVLPAGWTEWPRLGKPSLPTVYYAEYESTGPGASPTTRNPYSHQLTAAEAGHWEPAAFLAGADHWQPAP